MTAIFVVLRVFIGWSTPDRGSPIEGASTDSPSVPGTVQVQVVASIAAADRVERRVAPIPSNVAALFELIQRDGSVTFAADEVDIVATPAREFDPEEVDVITAQRPEP